MRSHLKLVLVATGLLVISPGLAQDWNTGLGGAVGGGAGAAVGAAVGGRTGAAVGGALGGAAGGAMSSSGDAQTGAVVGGALGGAAGGVVGHKMGGTAGAAVGGAVGGGAGAMIGSSVTDSGTNSGSSAPVQTTTQVQGAARETHDRYHDDDRRGKKYKKKNVPRGNAYGWHRNQGE